ncbi:HAD family phosphatase [Glutamicibacter halophytocola]|uniref:HAD family phosphatase n=3 Tax=Glutamicibacter halophytocola TaxID=1933880 RepID=A0ABX5Y6P5_9MICC|nr:HAD family phosphatase [Glutamicibacter halophytocola]QDY65793.1 HAD family phosphatase [Glutamicibacter halophytocola]
MRLVDTVYFDYGGVMTGPVPETIDAWVAAEGIVPASFSRVLNAWMSRSVPGATPIRDLETGALPPDQFEAKLAAELETRDGSSVPPEGLLGRIFAQLHPDEHMFNLAAELRGLGLRVGLLSNSWGPSYPWDRIDPIFDPVVISEQVGLRKPDRRIYQHAVQKAGAIPERTLFIDDAEANLQGAGQLGLRTLLHRSPAATTAGIAQLVPGLMAKAGASR